jgi:hypothetical protein
MEQDRQLSEKEQFVEKLKSKIKNAETPEDKAYFIAMAKELFFDWTYEGED